MAGSAGGGCGHPVYLTEGVRKSHEPVLVGSRPPHGAAIVPSTFTVTASSCKSVLICNCLLKAPASVGWHLKVTTCTAAIALGSGLTTVTPWPSPSTLRMRNGLF